MQYIDDDELMHYGVLGMKWGVRRSRPSSGGRSSKGGSTRSKTASAASKAVEKAKSSSAKLKEQRESKKQSKSENNPSGDRVIKGHDSMLPGKTKLKTVRKQVNSMSDRELQEHINRLRNEEAYYRLKGFDDKTIKRIQKGRSARTSAFITQFSEVATSEVAKSVSKAVVAAGMAYVTKKAKDRYLPSNK